MLQALATIGHGEIVLAAVRLDGGQAQGIADEGKALALVFARDFSRTPRLVSLVKSPINTCPASGPNMPR